MESNNTENRTESEQTASPAVPAAGAVPKTFPKGVVLDKDGKPYVARVNPSQCSQLIIISGVDRVHHLRPGLRLRKNRQRSPRPCRKTVLPTSRPSAGAHGHYCIQSPRHTLKYPLEPSNLICLALSISSRSYIRAGYAQMTSSPTSSARPLRCPAGMILASGFVLPIMTLM